MGNRALICTEQRDIELYLHWNGGRDSVEAFLLYCKMQGFRTPEYDGYGWSRLSQVIANFFTSEYKPIDAENNNIHARSNYVGLSVGINKYDTFGIDGCDNGRYIIKNWEIISRESAPSREQNSNPLKTMLSAIDKAQPKNLKLGMKTINFFLKEYKKLGNELKLENIPLLK